MEALRRYGFLLVLALVGGLFGLRATDARTAEASILRLATTTSTDHSGLLSYLLPVFEAETRYTVHIVAVGTGKALRIARDGDTDAVLVHARAAEDRFMAAGHGIDRRDVMYNDFILVGPGADPAGLRKLTSVAEAYRRIALGGHLFISRGDDSGTHKKETELWKAAGIEPRGAWYREAGQGMGRVLLIAGELDAYTMTDRGTWLALKEKLPLEVLVAGDPPLNNQYGIIAVNPKRHPHVNHAGAKALIEWLTSPTGQRLIGEYRVNGKRLFQPNHAPGE